VTDERERQGLRRPFTREEMGRQRAIKGDERPGTEAHKRAEARLADMQNRPADYRADRRAEEAQQRPAEGGLER
jgi:hypothetical protein